jgi:hypothetical protein
MILLFIFLNINLFFLLARSLPNSPCEIDEEGMKKITVILMLLHIFFIHVVRQGIFMTTILLIYIHLEPSKSYKFPCQMTFYATLHLSLLSWFGSPDGKRNNKKNYDRLKMTTAVLHISASLLVNRMIWNFSYLLATRHTSTRCPYYAKCGTQHKDNPRLQKKSGGKNIAVPTIIFVDGSKRYPLLLSVLLYMVGSLLGWSTVYIHTQNVL